MSYAAAMESLETAMALVDSLTNQLHSCILRAEAAEARVEAAETLLARYKDGLSALVAPLASMFDIVASEAYETGVADGCADAGKTAEITKLRTALEWYADESNYHETLGNDAPCEVLSRNTVEETHIADRGDRARKALGR